MTNYDRPPAYAPGDLTGFGPSTLDRLSTGFATIARAAQVAPAAVASAPAGRLVGLPDFGFGNAGVGILVLIAFLLWLDRRVL